jgi:hypothetical protein
MGLSYSPKIITSGLVLYLDAANPKSYPGEPTTNLFTSNFTLDLNHSAASTSQTWTINKTVQSGESYTFSAEFYRDILHTGSLYIQFLLNNSSGVMIPGNSGTGDKTISFWIKPDAITDDIRILSNQSNTSFSIRFYGGNLQVWGNSWVTVCPAGAAGVWTNYTVTLSGTTVTGYKDGVLGSSGTTTFNLSSLRFGYPLNGANGTHYDGLLSRFTVHNRVLSNSQILQNYNAFKSRYT